MITPRLYLFYNTPAIDFIPHNGGPLASIPLIYVCLQLAMTWAEYGYCVAPTIASR